MFSYIALSMLSLLTIMLVTGFIWALRRNVQQSKKVRSQLQARLKELHLYEALGTFGIDATSYLYKNRIVDIEGHMRACRGCTTKEHCEDFLCRKMQASEFNFCPNNRKLADISAKV